MKTPDKIYLEKSLSNPDRLHSQWYPNDVIGGGIEYIRKDALIEWLMDEMDKSEKFSTCEHYSNVIEHLEEM